MADNKNAKLTEALKHIDNSNVGTPCSAMLSPHDTKLDKIEKELNKNNEKKERAVNPLAIRPSGAHVTLTEEKPKVSIIKNLFGF